MKKPSNKVICPNCGDGEKVADVESGELICTKCGYVIYERVGDFRRLERDCKGAREQAEDKPYVTCKDRYGAFYDHRQTRQKRRERAQRGHAIHL